MLCDQPAETFVETLVAVLQELQTRTNGLVNAAMIAVATRGEALETDNEFENHRIAYPYRYAGGPLPD